MTETHRRYWLLLFGADLRGRTAAVYVQEEGLPEGLAVICDELGEVLRDRALELWGKSQVAA